MQKDKRLDVAIIAGATMVFCMLLWLVRSQQTVGDLAYMGDDPASLIAIMTSERAHIKDAEVRRLADGIIDAQVRLSRSQPTG